MYNNFEYLKSLISMKLDYIFKMQYNSTFWLLKVNEDHPMSCFVVLDVKYDVIYITFSNADFLIGIVLVITTVNKL